jgi:signal transduction histidine kinase
MNKGGRLVITASIATNDRSAQEVEITVTDDGCGIDPSKLSSIFETFVTFDTDSPAGGSAAGYGLGLMVCRHLVDGVGGRITVSSVVGEGSTFRLAIPAVASAPRRKSA